MGLYPERRLWILSGATYSIAPGLVLDGHALRDADGRRFSMNAAGAALCALGEEDVDVDTAASIVEAASGGAVDARGQVHTFLTEMSAAGLVSIHQSFFREFFSVLRELPAVLAVVLLDRSLLYRGRFPRRIYPPSGRHVVLGTLEAHQGLAWLGLTLAGLAAMLLGSAPVDSLNMLAGDTRWQLAAALLAFFLLLITTAVVHESAHYLMARRLGCPVDGIYVRAGAAGVLYRPRPGGSSGRAVVLAGPLVGAAFLASALVVLVGLPATWWLGLGLDQMQLSLAVAVTVLLVHQLVALTPLAKDGRELIRLTRLARVSLSATEHQPRRTSGPGEGQGEHAPRP